MSLLEDIFLQDEANEAQELERVMQGDEYDERPRSLSLSGDESDGGDGAKRESEAEEDKRRVDPSSTKVKRVTKNPRFILNPARLTGPRGIQVIPEHFKDFKFKGKGREKEDLDMVLKKLEHWAYRLYPKFQFQDCLKKIESLGKKRPVMVHLHKIRTDQFLSEETVVQKDSSDDEAHPVQEEDEFDKLLQQQIDLARSTPGPGSVKKNVGNDQWQRLIETPVHDDRSSFTMPKATSSPSISDEQKERMIRNRKLAEERRLARLKQNSTMDNNSTDINTNTEINNDSRTNENTEDINIVSKKVNRPNVIDSSDSDEENNMNVVAESIVVEVHHNSHRHEAKTAFNETNSHTEEIIINDQDMIANDKGDVVNVSEPNIEHSTVVDATDKINNEINLNKNDNVITEETCDSKNNDNVDRVYLSDDNYCAKESNSETIEINNHDSNKINDTVNIKDANHNLEDNTRISERNTVDREQIEGNSPQVDENIKEKASVEDLKDVMDVDFSDDF